MSNPVTPTGALPHAGGGPVAAGRIKVQPEDFVVEEILGFEPSGDGEHAFLHIRKRGENTDYIARQLAKFAGLARQAVSYAGMKDRHGVTSQWFSVHLPGKPDPDWSAFDSATVTVLRSQRHHRKLKKGALQGNRFEITVQELRGQTDRIEEKLQQMLRDGVPNFFGPQRFGRDGQNLVQAAALFSGQLKLRDRNLEAIYFSAARSHIFNQVLARRVESGEWNRAVAGDVFMFADSHSFFRDDITPAIESRLAALEIHPSGPLWGRGASAASARALDIEQETAALFPLYCEGLERAGLEMSRRPLRLPLTDLAWDFPSADSLRLRFSLPAGAYATAVLREAVEFEGSVD